MSMQQKPIKITFFGGLNSLCPYLNKLGIETVPDVDASVDIVFTGSVPHYKAVVAEAKKYGKPVIQYVWDLYEWAWEGKRPNDYDWRGYVEAIKQADHVWCPNEGTRLRIKEYAGRDSDIVHSHIDYYDLRLPDEGYVLHHMRDYPVDQRKWPKKACEELGLPYVFTNHQLSLEDYRKTVSQARLLVTPYDEASTGGLTLLEGLWNGVPSLVSDSKYSGGVEYLGPHANTFKAGDYEDFKKQLKELYENPPTPDAKEYLQQFSGEEIAKVFKKKLCSILQRQDQ